MEKRRIVIKVGTSTLAHATGRLNIRRVEQIVKAVSDIRNSGVEVILVSSGSIGLGMGKLGLSEKPCDTPTKQACAAVGQCELMYMYDKLFSEYNLVVAQLLLTKYVLLEGRRTNVENAVEKLLEKGAIPIVNENDTVAIDELELEVGENDSLAATVAAIARADTLIIMTDIDGLFNKNPDAPDAELIGEVFEITDELKAAAGGSGSALGSGGMITKLNAAEIAMNAGIDTVIVNGKNPEILYDVVEGKPTGTIFRAGKGKR